MDSVIFPTQIVPYCISLKNTPARTYSIILHALGNL